MDKIKYIFILIALLAVFLLGKQCNNTSKNDLKPHIDTLIVHKVHYTKDTITVYKTQIKTIFKYIEINKPIDTTEFSKIRQYRQYNDTIRDSNLVINTNQTVLGYLISRQLSYKLLVPLRIYDTTLMTITKEIPKPILPEYQLRVGVSANPKNVYIVTDFEKNRITYNIGYDPFNKEAQIGLKYTIWYK